MFKTLNFLFAIEACCAIGLILSKNDSALYLLVANAAVIQTLVADN